ncbi:hypothetical protein [Paenibacillus xylanilyticus]|nr:hypothetical protein [Paenibacillus xylanilyticus]
MLPSINVFPACCFMLHHEILPACSSGAGAKTTNMSAETTCRL